MQPLVNPLNHGVVENVVIKVMDGADHAQKVREDGGKRERCRLHKKKDCSWTLQGLMHPYAIRW